MFQTRTVRLESTLRPPRRPLPRRSLRKLLAISGIRPGTSVLVASQHNDDGMAGYLAYLGVDVRAAVRCRTTRAEREASPRSVTVGEILDVPTQRFDAVLLLDGFGDPSGSLNSTPALQTTGNLISLLEPDGRLVLFHRCADSVAHGPKCLDRHLSRFNDRIDSFSLPTDSWLARVWRYGRGQTADNGLVARLELNGQAPPQSELLEMAATENSATACCESIARHQSAFENRRSAA